MEYSSSSTYSQKMLHSIHYSSIPPLPIPKNYQREYSLRRKMVSLKPISATKKPLVKYFEPPMSFSAVPINTDKLKYSHDNLQFMSV